MSEKSSITPSPFLAIQYPTFFCLVAEFGITEQRPEWEDFLIEYARWRRVN
jgi:hypothetical protein